MTNMIPALIFSVPVDFKSPFSTSSPENDYFTFGFSFKIFVFLDFLTHCTCPALFQEHCVKGKTILFKD
jgi:hypothetical protein